MSNEILEKIDNYFKNFPEDEINQNNIIQNLIKERENIVNNVNNEYNLKIKELGQKQKEAKNKLTLDYNKQISEHKEQYLKNKNNNSGSNNIKINLKKEYDNSILQYKNIFNIKNQEIEKNYKLNMDNA